MNEMEMLLGAEVPQRIVMLESLGAEIPLNGYHYDNGKKVLDYSGNAFMEISQICQNVGAGGRVRIHLHDLSVHPQDVWVKGGQWMPVKRKLEAVLRSKLAKSKRGERNA